MTEETHDQSAPGEPSRFNGTVLSRAETARLLEIGEEEVEEMVSCGELLELPTADPNQPVYPAFQFRTIDAGTYCVVETLPFLQDVITAMREGTTDPWEIAEFLMASSEDAEGTSSTNADQLWAGYYEAVLSTAVETVDAWMR